MHSKPSLLGPDGELTSRPGGPFLSADGIHVSFQCLPSVTALCESHPPRDFQLTVESCFRRGMAGYSFDIVNQ